MIAALVFAATRLLGAGDSIWLEGEAPTRINVEHTVAGWGHKEFLSGDAWLQVSIEPDQIEKKVPAEGAVIEYQFQSSTGGLHEIWDRIGYEFVRSPFEWRIDQEAWKRIGPDDLTVDLQELQTWNEVAWLKLGEEAISPGRHNLQIRLSRSKDSAGKEQKVLYASDALFISSQPFQPNGKYPPSADYRSAIDQSAETARFRVPDAPGPGRQVIQLGGPWQIARDDEQAPGPVDQPIAELPGKRFWYGIHVPSDKNVARPELEMAHRVWYRTTLDVPASQIGRSFTLSFPQNSLNTTVYVNGVQCGFNPNPFVFWSCDVTKGVRAGSNEVLVGIRDAWYGYSADPHDPMKLRRRFNLPLEAAQGGFQDLSYPVWHAFESGILDTPRLTVAGAVEASDVFVEPRVAKHALVAEINLKNTTHALQRGSVRWEVVDDANELVVQRFSDLPFVIKANGEQVVHANGQWDGAKLWWPDSPNLYRLRVRVVQGSREEDVADTTFGFREWSVSGTQILLNGVVWHGWAELTQGSTKEEWLKNYRKTGQRFMRLSGPSQNGGSRWLGLSYEQALNWLDRQGVVVRRCGPLDGEAIGYNAVEPDSAVQTSNHTKIKIDLLNHWRDQMVAQVRGERNHPSIGMWSIENEWLYINCINLYGDLMDEFEREEKRTLDAVGQADPTRPAMADGGGAGRPSTFPIHGDHYVFTNDPGSYPDLAYAAFPDGGGRGRWQWDQRRPRYLGEDFFASGINPADYAWIEGEEAFGGKKASEKGMAQVQRMLTEGYRWSGEYAAWHVWLGDEGEAFGKSVANASIAAFCREWNWSFGGGQKVSRTFGVFNDGHETKKLDFRLRFILGDRPIQSSLVTRTVSAGGAAKFTVAVSVPSEAKRTDGRIEWSVVSGGQTIFRDSRPVSVLPAIVAQGADSPWLGLYDPGGRFRVRLDAAGFRGRVISDLKSIPAGIKVVVVAPDALDVATSTSPVLSLPASLGARFVVLEQAHPLHGQAIPATIEATEERGSFAFPEIANHPVFVGLKASDFCGWKGGVYRNAYRKPVRGARSLMQVGARLGDTALVEVPVGTGLLLLSQVRQDGAAPSETLLRNLVAYAREYRLIKRTAAVYTQDPLLLASLGRVGLQFSSCGSALDALRPQKRDQMAILSATPETLHVLATHLNQVRAYCSMGNVIVFHGVGAEGLADFNKIVGVEQLIRPFRREKVQVRRPRDPLAAGLSEGDVVMYSGEKMFEFNDDHFVVSDEFSHVLDYDDVAPFAILGNDYLYNTVNGFVSSDGWKYICSFDLARVRPEYIMEFARPQTFTGMTWTGNAFYHKVKRFSLTFDHRDTVTFDVQPNDVSQELPISPARTGKLVELKILEWTHEPEVGNVVGIDNISLYAARSNRFRSSVHPLLNIGGIIRYDAGAGQIVMENLMFKAREETPENADKKLRILSTLLQNLNGPFAATKTVIAGSSQLDSHPLDLSHQANQYRGARGCFGDPATTLADLPSGRQKFAGVPFEVFSFLTSPVPDAVMLNGPGVPGNLPDRVTGIPVERKAAALFFLQAARIDRKPEPGKVGEVAEYVVHYADGSEAVIPIRAGLEVEDYRAGSPQNLNGALLAWSRRAPDGKSVVSTYVQQWNNPRPEAMIRSLELRYGAERYGVPVLIAVTAAN